MYSQHFHPFSNYIYCVPSRQNFVYGPPPNLGGPNYCRKNALIVTRFENLVKNDGSHFFRTPWPWVFRQFLPFSNFSAFRHFSPTSNFAPFNFLAYFKICQFSPIFRQYQALPIFVNLQLCQFSPGLKFRHFQVFPVFAKHLGFFEILWNP